MPRRARPGRGALIEKRPSLLEGRCALLPQTEPVNEGLVALYVFAVEVAKEAPPLAYKLQEPHAAALIVPVDAEMSCQAVDALCQECDLDFA